MAEVSLATFGGSLAVIGEASEGPERRSLAGSNSGVSLGLVGGARRSGGSVPTSPDRMRATPPGTPPSLQVGETPIQLQIKCYFCWVLCEVAWRPT